MQENMTDYQYKKHLQDIIAIAERCATLTELIEELKKRLEE